MEENAVSLAQRLVETNRGERTADGKRHFFFKVG